MLCVCPDVRHDAGATLDCKAGVQEVDLIEEHCWLAPERKQGGDGALKRLHGLKKSSKVRDVLCVEKHYTRQVVFLHGSAQSPKSLRINLSRDRDAAHGITLPH